MQDEKNKKIKESFEIILEYDDEDKTLIISSENSSGAKYDCNNIYDLKDSIQEYIDNYIDYEYERER